MPSRGDLYEAMDEIGQEFRANIPGYWVCMKEKHGYAVFEHIFPDGLEGQYEKQDKIAHWKVLYRIVANTAEKHPHLKDYLLQDLASNDDIVPKEVHDMYWKTDGVSEDEALVGLIKERSQDLANAICVNLDGPELMPGKDKDEDFGFDGESG